MKKIISWTLERGTDCCYRQRNNEKIRFGVSIWASFGSHLTFEDPKTCPSDHPGTPLAPDPEKPQKNHFFGPHFQPLFGTFWECFEDCFLTYILNLSRTRFWCQRHPQASISRGFGCLLDHTLNKSEQIETAIPCEREYENQALEGLYFTLFRHFHTQILGTFNFHVSFDDWSPFYTFVHPLETHF